MSERRYSDDEVSAIFARATEAQQESRRHVPSTDGMTLAELQEIGREVGIEPDQIARAARSLDVAPLQRPPKFLGLPLFVAHAVELEHRMTDAQWERLVVDLRDTFGAAGRVRSDGTFRSWRNGNLQVLVEPDGEGTRVRFRTMKGSARSMMTIGLAFVVVAVIGTLFEVVGDGTALSVALSEFLTFLLVGSGMFAFGALQVPTWARLRQRQMEEIGARLLQLPPPLPKP